MSTHKKSYGKALTVNADNTKGIHKLRTFGSCEASLCCRYSFSMVVDGFQAWPNNQPGTEDGWYHFSVSSSRRRQKAGSDQPPAKFGGGSTSCFGCRCIPVVVLGWM